jgi:Leucine-rich repeat (LRR) protein
MVLVLALGCWLGWAVHRARVQRDAVAAVERAGGRVVYDPDWFNIRLKQTGGRGGTLARARMSWPKWLVDRLGPDLFYNVRYVAFSGTGFANLEYKVAVAEVGRLQGLDELMLGGGLDDSDLVHLRGLTRLRRLRMFGPFTGAGLANLSRATRLEEFLIPQTVITDAEMVHLEGLTNLQTLKFDSSRLTDAGLAHLRGLVKLKQLDLNESRVTSSGLNHLRGMTGLTHLSLTRSRVDDLAPIAHLNGLVALGLSGTPVDDAGLAPVRGFKALRHLDISGTRITDAALGDLAGRAFLVTLDFSNTPVTDAGLSRLTGLSSIRWLSGVSTQATFRGRRAFQSSYPFARMEP